MFSDYKLMFPVYEKDYDTLAKKLFNNELLEKIEISNVTITEQSVKEKLYIGASFDEELYSFLESTELDSFGENGEFHTKCVFKTL